MSEQLIPTPGVFGENGNFLLERELGAGGMGGVYMGRDKMLDRPVAVKVMLKEYGADAEFVEKFKKEAQSAARLIHPNIAQVYSYGICDNMPYIAMELASGGSLYTIMNANPGKTDIARVVKICQQVAQALQCASDQGCVHGDVKPENILLDANGNAKLVDFGLAAMQKDTDEIWGTPYYISPEKVKKEPVDFRADMYSLGGTLYHALTGVAPFEGEDAIAVVRKRFDGAPKKPSEIRPEISPAIDDLVMQMLALDKEERFPSFESLLEAFRNVMTNGLPTTTSSTARMKRPAVAGTPKKIVAGRAGRRVVMRRPGMASVGGSSVPKPGDDEDTGIKNPVDAPSGDEDSEEGGGNLAIKVLAIIVGSILLIGGVIGGLIWYQVADRNQRIREEQAQISGGIEKAKEAIRTTVAKANEFADEFDEFAQKAVVACRQSSEELKKYLPEFAASLNPAPSKELMDAIASTNEPVAAVAAPADAAPASTNAAAAAAAPAATNAPPPAAAVATNAAPAEAQAKPAEPEKKEEARPEQKEEKLPSEVITMLELWDRAYGCQASAIRIRHAIRQLVKRAEPVDAAADPTRERMDSLAELSRQLVEELDKIKTSKDVENVRKGISFIKSRGEKAVDQTIKRLRREKLESDRKAKKEAAEAAEKARQEKLAAERKAMVDAETSLAKEKFDMIVNQGCFRQLDWKSALRQLEFMKADFKTAEGQLAANLEIRKVNAMKKVHDIFIAELEGHVFRGKLKGCKVASVNEREINLVKADGKTRLKIFWQKFYHDYPGNLNEIINLYIVKARQLNARHKMNLSEWAEAMTGSALTMKLVCADVNGAIERSETLAKEIVKEFPDYLSTAAKIFPDIKFEAAEEL